MWLLSRLLWIRLFLFCFIIFFITFVSSERKGACIAPFFNVKVGMQIEQRVRELVEEKIADREDLFIVSIKMQQNGVLAILVDGDQGIAIEDCAQISRHVGYHLEEENVIDKAYRLEVSSPGIDSALQSLRQYRRNVGRNVRVVTTEGQKREGRLLEVSEADIQIEEKVKEKGKKAVLVTASIPLEDIKETKVLISFK